jgi:hypothetical protein
MLRKREFGGLRYSRQINCRGTCPCPAAVYQLKEGRKTPYSVPAKIMYNFCPPRWSGSTIIIIIIT